MGSMKRQKDMILEDEFTGSKCVQYTTGQEQRAITNNSRKNEEAGSKQKWCSVVVALGVKNLPANAGDIRDTGLIPVSGRSPGGGLGYPLQYTCLENPKDRGAWWATVHRVTKSWTQLKWLSMHAQVVKVKSDVVKKKYCLGTWNVLKRKRNQRSNCQHSLDHRESKGTPKPLYCLLRNLHAGQKATVRTGHGTTDWFQIGKGVHQGYILSPCLFNFYAGYIMKNSGLDESQVGIRIVGRNITTSDMQMIPL